VNKKYERCLRCKGFKITRFCDSAASYSELRGTRKECSHVWTKSNKDEVVSSGLD